MFILFNHFTKKEVVNRIEINDILSKENLEKQSSFFSDTMVAQFEMMTNPYELCRITYV